MSWVKHKDIALAGTVAFIASIIEFIVCWPAPTDPQCVEWKVALIVFLGGANLMLLPFLVAVWLGVDLNKVPPPGEVVLQCLERRD